MWRTRPYHWPCPRPDHDGDWIMLDRWLAHLRRNPIIVVAEIFDIVSHPPSPGTKISWRSMVSHHSFYCSIIVCITALIILKQQTKHIAFTNQNNCTVIDITAHVRLIIILKKCDGMRRKQLIGWCLRVWGCPSATSHHRHTHTVEKVTQKGKQFYTHSGEKSCKKKSN